MSRPTFSDWNEHMTTYGGVAVLLLIQTALLIIVTILFRKAYSK